MSESDTVRLVCDYLAVKKYFFWRMNNHPTFNWETKSFRAMPKYAMKGVPDIILIKDGFFVGLEVKQAKGRQSPEQKEFEARVKAEGGEYYVIRTLEDLKEVGL